MKSYKKCIAAALFDEINSQIPTYAIFWQLLLKSTDGNVG